MRMKPKASLQDTHDAMSPEQRAAYARAVDACTKLAEVRKQASKQADLLNTKVAQALAVGVPVGLLAGKMGLTRARIYQMQEAATARR